MGDEDVVASVAPKRPLPVDFVEMVARRLIVRESGVTDVALDVFRLGGSRGRIVNRHELAVDVDVLRPVIPAMFMISNQFFAKAAEVGAPLVNVFHVVLQVARIRRYSVADRASDGAVLTFFSAFGGLLFAFRLVRFRFRCRVPRFRR